MKQDSPPKSAARADGPAEAAAGETLDHESRLHEGDHEALRLWLRLLTCTNLIEAQIRADLR
ncbi:MAG TPA: hypothetical protein VH105_14895, partial [Burkholderiales bacterium]|nr:hypothetical protein [Burkholderiales bacterium]